MLQEDFKRLNQNYQDKFIKYLTDFVQELQHHSKRIEQILRQQMPLIEGMILEKVIQSEMEIPHAFLETGGNLEPAIRENVIGKWDSLKRWFIDSDGKECESRKVLKITNEIIRSIIHMPHYLCSCRIGESAERMIIRNFWSCFWHVKIWMKHIDYPHTYLVYRECSI